jgi:hypothetical protein
MRMKPGPSRSVVLRVVVAVAAVAASAASLAQPAQAYCRSMGDTGARLTAFNAYGWVCSAAGIRHDIHVEQACAWQYSQPAARADFSSLNNPYSWYCYL